MKGFASPLAVLGIAVSIVAAWLAIRSVDFGDFRSALGDANPWLLALGAAGVLISYPLLGLRWRTVARGVGKMPRRDAIDWLLIGAAANNVLPTRLGEFVRAFGLRQVTNVRYLSAVGVVVVDRSADLLFFGACLAATVWLASDVGWVQWLAGLSGAAILILVVVLFAVALWVRRRSDGEPAEPGVRRYLYWVAVGLSTLRHPRQAVVAAGFTTAAWTALILGALAVSASLGMSITLPEMVFAIAVIGLGTALPSAPGFVGTYHWLAASSLTLFGAPEASALAFAVLLHATWFIPTTLVGVALLAQRGMTFVSLGRLRSAEDLG